MTRNNNFINLPLLTGAALAVSVSAGVSASQDANPFGMQDLSGGYMQMAEGKCGEGKCGEGKAKKEGKCGEGKAKKEGKYGESKANKEGKCGEGKAKKEGKCGEGKCGGKN